MYRFQASPGGLGCTPGDNGVLLKREDKPKHPAWITAGTLIYSFYNRLYHPPAQVQNVI